MEFKEEILLEDDSDLDEDEDDELDLGEGTEGGPVKLRFGRQRLPGPPSIRRSLRMADVNRP